MFNAFCSFRVLLCFDVQRKEYKIATQKHGYTKNILLMMPYTVFSATSYAENEKPDHLKL